MRYADDMVFIFEEPEDAKKIFAVLGKRLNKYGLALNEDKSSMVFSGRDAARRAAKAGERIPTYAFLGFTCYWGLSRKGRWRLKYTSRRDRFTATLKGLREFLWTHLNAQDTGELLKSVIRRVKGWINYHAISDNERRVHSFLQQVQRLILNWCNRRGGKHRTYWIGNKSMLARVGFPTTFKTISMFGINKT